MAKAIIKQTETLAIIKVSGTNVSETITLATDLLSSTMVQTGTLHVPIAFVLWNLSSGVSDTITITRNGVRVLDLFQNPGFCDFAGNGGFLENTQDSDDIVVQIVGTGAVYITVRKVGGYVSKVETAQFSYHDNVNAVGS